MSETKPGRVLILAAEPMVGRILEHKLRREGHEVVWERDGVAGREHLAHRYDVALIDVDGEGSDWMSAAVASRLGVQWLAVVDGRDRQGALAAMGRGAAGVVAKPFKPTAVAAQVWTLLGLIRTP
ncbi:MAG: hypothetical protein ABR564_09420 [Candidatus Dormibacteria bacterium]